MELYPVFVNSIALVAMTAGVLLAGWWAIGLYGVHSRKEEKELPEVELPSHLHEVISGIPPFLWIFYVFVAVVMVTYVLYIWLGGLTY